MNSKVFVKSATTQVSVDSSKREVEKLLKRYGCSRLQITEDYGRGVFAVAFALPDERGSAAEVPVRIEIEVGKVLTALKGTRGYSAQRLQDQAQRVAWRQLVLWLDAALSAATLGLQRITEAFFAHVIVGPNERMIDRVESQGDQIGIPNLRLLKSGTEDAR